MFTTTNAALMDACFNRNHWKNWERTLRDYLTQKLNSDRGSATAFIVQVQYLKPHTGTSKEPERVTVPSHIWTAGCYKHNTDDTKPFFFGYIGRNHPTEPGIRLMSVLDLNISL